MASPSDREMPLVLGSPKEDFNPLDDDLPPKGDVEVTEGDQDEDSPCSSLGAENFDPDQYGVTPPNPRALRRDKARVRSNKYKLNKVEMRECLEHQRGEKARAMNRGGIVRDSISDDVVSCNLDENEIGPDDIFEPPSGNRASSKKKDGGKNFKTSRAYERDFKHSSSDLVSLENQFSSLPVQPLKVDSPQQFRCLESQPVIVNQTHTSVPVSTPRRQSTHSNIECPKDRFAFYKTFSMLINLGNQAQRAKESKIRPYSRQLSSEQEVWQTQINDLLWLELQAWFQGRRTLKQQDVYLCKARERVPEVLQQVLIFRVQLKQSPVQAQDCSDKLGSVTRAWEENKQSCCEHSITTSGPCPMCSQHSNNNVKDVTKSPSQWCLRGEIDQQREAIVQVSKVLRKLEKVEKLYPTSKALGRDHSLYASEAFQHRVNTLCLWRNITRDTGHKLQLMSQLLCLDHTHHSIDWPWLYYDMFSHSPESQSLGCLMPEICVTSADEDEEDEEEEDTTEEESDGEPIITGQNDGCDPQSGTLPHNKYVRFNLSGSPSSAEGSYSSPNASFVPSDSSTPKKLEAIVRNFSISSSLSRTSSTLSMDDTSRTAIYRYFVDRMLKKSGLRKLLMRLKDILDGTLQRARQALERPSSAASSTTPQSLQTASPTADILSTSPSLDGLPSVLPCMDRRVSLAMHGVWSEEFVQMGLPSFKPAYLCLLRIPLDVVHECLRLRLEQRPETDPSYMSVRQLIRECKEVLLGAVTVKQYYQQMVSAVVSEEDGDSGDMDLEQFEEDMQKMMEVYFDYIRTWMSGLQDMPVMSKRLKNFLEEEWNFTKQVCPHIVAGEASAGKKFCLMASSLLNSISDYLENGMDECINQLYDSTLPSHDSQDDNELSDEDEELKQLHNKRSSRSGELRQAIIQTCRTFKEHFHEARERASKALGFAKMLRKDLEVAADFNISVTAEELLQKLKDTSHVRVVAPVSAGYLMFVPEHISEDEKRILPLLNVTCGREDISSSDISSPEGYLLLVKYDGCLDYNPTCPSDSPWDGPAVKVTPTAEITVALSHIEVESLFLVVIYSTQLSAQRKEFERLMGSAVQLVSDQTSCHQAIAESLSELKSAAMTLRERVADAIAQVDEKLNLEDIADMDDCDKHNIQKLYRETLHQCYNFGFEYHREVTRLVSGEVRSKLSQLLVQFAKQWMKFVTQKCERGRGVRPRWAGQGLDFLIVACEPRVLAILTEEEFAELKHCINNTITHVVGDKATSLPFSAGGGFRVSSPDVSTQLFMRNISVPEPLHPRRSTSVRSTHSEPPTPFSPGQTDQDRPKSLSNSTLEAEVEVGEGRDGGIVLDIHSRAGGDTKGEDTDEESEILTRRRMHASIRKLEQKRTNRLYKKEVIGRVTDKQVHLEYHINVRRVNFKWQRGIKIGEGQFGKVYTAVNMESGELMAMKEIRLQPNDHQTLKDISDELKIFEGISHPSLVKYYGVEVHREEMLIFMEYCAEGTLEEAAKQGLLEGIIRKYTREIVVGVNTLHDHGIVHRDIKGANIFLTSKGLKLGDFGSCVKLKNHTTMPGEVNNLVGTTAFMAPEVITRNESEGSGRASDIWSLGCAVIQMATGKRPWHELENNFMVMFKVGMGGSPPIPDNLNVEGKDFLSHCLETDPKERWTASQLQDHPFVKVFLDEEPFG